MGGSTYLFLCCNSCKQVTAEDRLQEQGTKGQHSNFGIQRQSFEGIQSLEGIWSHGPGQS